MELTIHLLEDFAQTLVLAGIATFSFSIYVYFRKMRALDKLYQHIYNHLVLRNCSVSNRYSEQNCDIQDNMDLLKFIGVVYELHECINSLKLDDPSKLDYELMKRIAELRITFLSLCNDLSPSERKDVLEGLYNQKSELHQSKYMLNILNNVIEKSKNTSHSER